MAKKDFYEKHGIHFKDTMEEYIFLGAMDKLYLEFTKEQVLELVSDFYDHADDIFNEAKEEAAEIVKESTRKLMDALNALDEEDSDEDEESLDKMPEA